MARIRLKNGPLKGKVFQIGDEPLTLGREPNCSLQIMDKGASRHHAEIFCIGEMCFIRDLDSRNGTFVNEEGIQEEMLREGDRIQIGATIIAYESSGADDSSLEFTDEEDTSSTLELKLEDLTDLTASQGDGDDVRRLRGLYRLGRMIGETTDEKGLIDKVLPFVSELIEAEMVYLFTRNSDTGAIAPIGSYFAEGKEGGKISRSIIKRSIVDKRAILTSDAMSDGRFKAQESIMMKGIRSVICVPLSVSGSISGVLYLSSNNLSVVFSDDELELAAATADQIGMALANFRNRGKLRENLMSTISALVKAVEMHDPTSQGKSERVARYASVIGKKLGLSEDVQQGLELSGLLHNIGILAEGEISHFAQSSKEKYSSEKSSSEKLRVDATLNIISTMDCYPQIEKTIRYMYERNDASGPEKLTAAEIPATAKILGLAIDFDSMANRVSEESEKVRVREAIAEVNRQAGRKYDESAVKGLLLALRDGSLEGALPNEKESK